MLKLSYLRTESNSAFGLRIPDSKTIPDFLRFHYENRPHSEAIVFAHSDGSRQAIIFKDIYHNAQNMARGLLSLGIKKTEVVAVSLRDCPEWLYVVYGAMMAGVRPIGLQFTYTDGSDVIGMMKTCSAIILDPGAQEENWNIFKKLVSNYDRDGSVKSEKMPYLRNLICKAKPNNVQNVLTVRDILNRTYSDICLPVIDPGDIAILYQTSGSTGMPKAVAHTHNSILSAMSLMSVDSAKTYNTAQKLFNDRPFAWVGGFPSSPITGQCRVTLSRFDNGAEDYVGYVVDAIKKEKCTVVICLPMLLNNLIERQGAVGEDWPVHTIVFAGQPMNRRFVNCIGNFCSRIVLSYASTEFLLCAGITIDKTDDFKQYLVGPPLPGKEIKTVNENEEIVPVNTSGEIYIKSPSLFKEYYNDPVATNACLTEDGWFRSDDVGFMDKSGKLYVAGRKSEMIIYGGMNVAPTILEGTIEKCKGVARAICVPVAHDVLYQVVCACVILETGSHLTEEKLRSYCHEVHNDKPRLFTVVPKYYIFLDNFPETDTGKIARLKLAKNVAELLEKQK